jgi:hypothetical protein
MKEARFTFITTMYELGEMTGHRMMSSELDVHQFEYSTVEDHISTIIWEFHENKRLRMESNTKGSVRFENLGNTLSPDDQLSGTAEELDLSDTKRQHLLHLVARERSKENEGSRGSQESPQVAVTAVNSQDGRVAHGWTGLNWLDRVRTYPIRTRSISIWQDQVDKIVGWCRRHSFRIDKHNVTVGHLARRGPDLDRPADARAELPRLLIALYNSFLLPLCLLVYVLSHSLDPYLRTVTYSRPRLLTQHKPGNTRSRLGTSLTATGRTKRSCYGLNRGLTIK